MQEGEFAGVELTFMGLNNQNLHNFLFRGFLKPWEAYTGRDDQLDRPRPGRLQRPPAAVDRDRHGRLRHHRDGCALRGRRLRQGARLGDAGLGPRADRYGRLCRATSRNRSAPGTARPTASRSTATATPSPIAHDYYDNEEFAAAWAEAGGEGDWAPPKTWAEVNAHAQFLKGKTDPLTGLDAHGFLDPLKGWGGFGFYFLEDRATAYAKHPDDPAWLFDPDTMKPRVNNPAFVRAIQEVMDIMDTFPPDQINADPGTTAFQQFLAGTGSSLAWWGDVGSSARTSDTSVVGDVVGFGILPGADEVYNSKSGEWDADAERGAEHGLYRLGRLRHGARRRRREEA